MQFQGLTYDSCHPDYLDAQRRLEERDGGAFSSSRSEPAAAGGSPACLVVSGRKDFLSTAGPGLLTLKPHVPAVQPR